eukprot:12314373-Alexandrium_andersonii.AAC.1
MTGSADTGPTAAGSTEPWSVGAASGISTSSPGFFILGTELAVGMSASPAASGQAGPWSTGRRVLPPDRPEEN